MRNCRPFSKHFRKFYVYTILIFLLGVIWVVCNLLVGQEIILCPTRRFFHIPCPGCGMTRALFVFLHGNIKEALFYNANIIFLFPTLIIVFVCIIHDVIFSKLLLFNLYNQINSSINRWYFFVLFLIFEIFVEFHHLTNII